MHIIELINLFFLTGITGGWMMGTAIIVNAQKRMSAAAYVEEQQINTRFGCVYFPGLFVGTVISQIIFLMLHGTQPAAAFWRSLSSLIVVILLAAFTAAKVLPINRLMRTWSPIAPPVGWQRFRAKWRIMHRVRTVLMIIAWMLQASVIIWK